MQPSDTKFLETLCKSGLIEHAQLEKYLESLGEERPKEAAGLASRMVADHLLTPFQHDMLLRGRFKGFILKEKYKILDLLGVGGMGRVFLCEHLMLHRRVAMKTLSGSQLKEPGAVERLLREARAVAALDDPNIVRIYDLEREGEVPLVILEYVDGESLQTYVADRGTLSIEETSHYISQAALGLQHAYEVGVIHRDIKPANLLLSRDGTIKILDMGLARFTNPIANHSLTEKYDSNSVLGTADYLSPEQAVDCSSVDIRADIYALGGTMFYLLTGNPPYQAKNQAEKLLAHQMRPLPSLRSRRPEAPAALEAIFHRMMAKSREDRFSTPSEVVEALAPWTQNAIALPVFPQPSLSAPGRVTIGGPGVETSGKPRSKLPGSGRPACPIRAANLDGPRRTKTKFYSLLGAISLILCGGGVAGYFALSKSPDSNNTVHVPEPVNLKLTEVISIPSEKASDYVGQLVEVKMEIRSTGIDKSSTMLFLNSKASRNDADNLTVVVPANSAKVLWPGMELAEIKNKCEGRTITVKGKVTLFPHGKDGKPQIKIAEANQLQLDGRGFPR